MISGLYVIGSSISLPSSEDGVIVLVMNVNAAIVSLETSDKIGTMYRRLKHGLHKSRNSPMTVFCCRHFSASTMLLWQVSIIMMAHINPFLDQDLF